MSSQDTMKSSELRELADLDALGLLDEVDSHRFEQALANATIADQEMVRARQAILLQRLVGDPSDELPVELKDRVLGALRQEIERQDEQFAPIATIGRRRRERSFRGETATPDIDLNYVETVRLRRAAVIWRAASFGLSAGLIAAVIFAVSTSRWNQTTLEVASQQDNNLEQRERYAEDFDELTSEASSDLIFTIASATRDAHCGVTVLISTTPSEQFLKLQLTGFRSGSYEIGRMRDGQWQVSHRFDVHEANTLVDIDNISVDDAVAFAEGDWEIRDVENHLIAKTFDAIVI